MPKALVFASAALLVLVGGAEAASITFENQLFTGGSGIGTVPTILVLQGDPAGTSETGGILWDGTADVEVGDAKSSSQTWSVAELTTFGITAADPFFGLVLNLNETSGADEVDLAALELLFFDAAGGLLFVAPYSPPSPLLTLDEEAQGTGSSGFLFRVELSSDERTQFFAMPGNRIGILASILRVDSGPETVYLASFQGLQGGPPVQPLEPVTAPEPASVVLFGSGLAAVAFRHIRSRRSSHARPHVRDLSTADASAVSARSGSCPAGASRASRLSASCLSGCFSKAPHVV
jgi:hypothetical protein